jgi:uncharacterized protein (DUF58 family)
MRDELSHEILRFLDQIELGSSLKSKNWLSGRHQSLTRGDSPEFKQFREARRGDSYRQIDWKSSARSSKKLVREQEHQGTLEHWIVLDTSRSMDFPQDESNKHRRQKLLCGLLMYLLQSQGDHFSLNFNTDHGPRCLAPSRGPDALHRFIGELADLETEPSLDQIDLLTQVQSQVTRPAHLWIITDFDRDPEPLLAELKKLKQSGHEVRALHLFHPSERELSWKGLVQFEDLEDQVSQQKLTPETIAQEYQLAYIQHINSIEKHCNVNEIKLCSIDVTQSPEHWITSLFSSNE